MENELGAEEARWLLASFGDPSKMTWTLSEQISSKLAEGIILGIYAPGQPLLEISLAESFGVSRGPVREALRILEREGLVVIQPRRGVTVKNLTPLDIKEIFGVRAVLYGFVASELAQRHTPEVLTILRNGSKVLNDVLKEKSVDQFLALLYRLSMYLPDAAGNSYAREILFSVGRQTLSFTRRVMLIEENRCVWAANWEKMVEAIGQSNVRMAEEAARLLVSTVYASTMELLDSAGASTEPASVDAAKRGEEVCYAATPHA